MNIFQGFFRSQEEHLSLKVSGGAGEGGKLGGGDKCWSMSIVLQSQVTMDPLRTSKIDFKSMLWKGQNTNRCTSVLMW